MDEPQVSHQINHFWQQKNNQNYTFYHTLAHYQPLCTASRPNNQQRQSLNNKEIQQQEKYQQYQQYYVNFLLSEGWSKSFICIMSMNVLFILTFLTFILDDRILYVQSQDSSMPVLIKYGKSHNYFIMKALCVVFLAVIDISYLMTQFLNPGIRNLANIPAQQLTNSHKTQFCHKCNQYRTQQFTHCSECEVCIWKFDHHCGFFDKCIGGNAQTYSFYTFLASVTLGFITLICCMCIQMGQF